jgi:hypothetical protein
MKLYQLAAMIIALLAISVSSPIALADSKSPEYVVKSFKLLGDEAVSNALNSFSQKNNLIVVSCSLSESDLICVFQKRS